MEADKAAMYNLHMEWITACEDSSHRLTKWEENFIASIKEQLETKGSLSELQAEVLEKIYAEKTD